MVFDSIYDLNDNELFSKVVNSHKYGQWHFADDEFEVPFIILLDEESDSFIVSIEDVENEFFVLVSPNTYYSLSTNKLHEIIDLVSEYCHG